MFTAFQPPRQRIDIANSGLRAEVWPELGGALARLQYVEARHAGATPARELLRPVQPANSYTPMELGCWPLVPYANRLRDGELPAAGPGIAGDVGTAVRQEASLPRNFPDQHHPLHGVGWLAAWRVERQARAHCRLELAHAADESWPWSFAATLDYALRDDCLDIALAARNSDRQPMPAGLGLHPYIVSPAGTRLRFRARRYWQVDATLLPSARVPVPAEWRTAEGMTLGKRFLDNCFELDADGAEVCWPDGSRLELRSAAAPFLHVYNPVGSGFVCVEPVTHLPDVSALRRSDPGLPPMAVLAPGATLELRSTLCFVPPVVTD